MDSQGLAVTVCKQPSNDDSFKTSLNVSLQPETESSEEQARRLRLQSQTKVFFLHPSASAEHKHPVGEAAGLKSLKSRFKLKFGAE